jgi:hypothetical protein
LSDHLNGKTRSKKLRLVGGVNTRRRSSCGCLGFVYVESWAINLHVIV